MRSNSIRRQILNTPKWSCDEMTNEESRAMNMMKSMVAAHVKVRRHYDALFKREAVAEWLASGKSAEIVAHELDLIPDRLFA